VNAASSLTRKQWVGRKCVRQASGNFGDISNNTPDRRGAPMMKAYVEPYVAVYRLLVYITG